MQPMAFSLLLDSTRLRARVSYHLQHDSIRRSRITNVAANLLSTYNLRQTEFILGVVHPFSHALRLQTMAYANLTKGWDRLENILGGQKNYVYVH